MPVWEQKVRGEAKRFANRGDRIAAATTIDEVEAIGSAEADRSGMDDPE
jgi:hypothetical protein